MSSTSRRRHVVFSQSYEGWYRPNDILITFIISVYRYLAGYTVSLSMYNIKSIVHAAMYVRNPMPAL